MGLCSDFARIRVCLFGIRLKCPIFQLSCLFRVDPTATSDDRQETPCEIALGGSHRLEVLLILGKFMEMPDDVKHVQLAVLLNRDEDEECGSNEEFYKILNSLPVNLVGFLKYKIKYSLDFASPGEHQKASTRNMGDDSPRCSESWQSKLCSRFA